MKTRLIVCISIITSICTVSCQKEFADESVVILPPPSSVTDSIYISKIYGLDSTSLGIDTTSIITFHYDGLKRVVRISDSVTHLGAWKLFSDDVYYYNGTTLVPERKVYYSFENYIANSNNVALIDTLQSKFGYDQGGKKIFDSTVSISHHFQGAGVESSHYTVLTNYQYIPGKIYSQSRTIHASTQLADTIVGRDTASLETRGNVVSSKTYYTTGGVYELTMTSLNTYDTNPNPFAVLNIFSSLNILPSFDNSVGMASFNNILKLTRTTYSDVYEQDYAGAYRYGSNGYPTFVGFFNIPGVTSSFGFAYTYKSL